MLSFLSMWNELLLGMMLLPDESKRLLTPTIALLLGRLLTNQPLLMAGLLISSLPTVLMLTSPPAISSGASRWASGKLDERLRGGSRRWMVPARIVLSHGELELVLDRRKVDCARFASVCRTPAVGRPAASA